MVEVGGHKEQRGILKIKAELDTYQKDYGIKYKGNEHFSMKKNDFYDKEPGLKTSLKKIQKKKRLNRRQSQPEILLDTFKENSEVLLHRACTVNGVKKSKSTPIATSRLGQLVEKNARSDSIFF